MFISYENLNMFLLLQGQNMNTLSLEFSQLSCPYSLRNLVLNLVMEG